MCEPADNSWTGAAERAERASLQTAVSPISLIWEITLRKKKKKSAKRCREKSIKISKSREWVCVPQGVGEEMCYAHARSIFCKWFLFS